MSFLTDASGTVKLKQSASEVKVAGDRPDWHWNNLDDCGILDFLPVQS